MSDELELVDDSGGSGLDEPEISGASDGIDDRFEYLPGVHLTPRVKQIATYEKAAIQVALGSNWISMAAMLFLCGMTLLDVLMRALFNTPIIGTYDWTRYLMVLIATFGMPLCTMNEEHVNIDFVVRKFPVLLQDILLWFNYAIVVFVMYIFITQNWVQGIFNATTGATSVGVPWPTYPFYYFIAVGFACMLAIVFVKMINLGRGVK